MMAGTGRGAGLFQIQRLLLLLLMADDANVAVAAAAILRLVRHELICGVDGCLFQRRPLQLQPRRTTAAPAGAGWRSSPDGNGRRLPLPMDAIMGLLIVCLLLLLLDRH